MVRTCSRAPPGSTPSSSDAPVRAPHLAAGKSIAVKTGVAAPPGGLVDRNGKTLDAPSLTPLLSSLADAVPATAAGASVVITDDAGRDRPEHLFTIDGPGSAPPLKLTIDAGLQAAAEAAVRTQSRNGTRPASLVAIEPSTGHILALAVASIAATVQNGTFRQPVLIPGLPQQPPARTLSAGTLKGLRSMMSRTARSGTAAPAMTGLNGDIGAKTCTAEIDGRPDNSWFTSYRDNLAVAAEVEGGDHGIDASAPAAAAVLALGNG
ncbi:penicillin-binding transpeptidase domain-containing protein [Kitasatospora sp. NPDC093806]|uniref:penicillin-binding transpeptidase domain-containing protein n=1 Tax=Kitasatospora sp. NPDC093806 TaxID=3155075 RepID=UPI00341E15D8